MSFGKRQPTGYRGFERRRAVREKADISAHIVLSASQFVNCRVTEFSSMGARLSVASVFGLPNMFELRAGARVCQVQIVRRAIGYVAVKFD